MLMGVHQKNLRVKVVQQLYITQSPNPPNTVLHRSHDEIVKLDKKRTDRAVITVNIM
jgi:hypothetical protein